MALGEPALPREPTAPARQVDHALAATRGEGARVVDDLGRTVLLRGVNVNGLGEYYQEHADLPSTLPLTHDDLRQIASHGFDVVRLILSWSRLEPQPGVIDETYLDRIEEVVGWAPDEDVYVLLDMHQDAWGPHVGTPDGVVCPPGLEPRHGPPSGHGRRPAGRGRAAPGRRGRRSPAHHRPDLIQSNSSTSVAFCTFAVPVRGSSSTATNRLGTL